MCKCTFQICCFANINILLLPFSLSPPLPLLKLPIVVIQKFCYHGNMTFTLLLSIKSTQIFLLSCLCRWMKNHLCHLFTRLKIHHQITVLSSLSDIYVQNYRHMYYEHEKVLSALTATACKFFLFIYLLLLYYYYYHYYYYCCYYSYCHYNYYQLYFFFVESTNRLLEEVKFQYQGISVEGGWDIDMHLSLENWLQWIKNS